MIDTSKLNWGLRPFRETDVLAAYGARTIFANGEIEFLRDRQGFVGDDDQRQALCNWINSKALPALKKHIREKGWTQTTDEIFEFKEWPFELICSPRASYGYIYMSAYMNGLESFPEVDGDTVKWSGNFIPEIGETVLARTNNIGPAKVLGFYLEHGWAGVIVKPNNPPQWYINQNGKDTPCGLFGAQIAQIEEDHN